MRLRDLLLGMCAIFTTLLAFGQNFDTPPPNPLSFSPNVIKIESWRVHAGDDPAWATAQFDDAGWASVSLPPRALGLNSLAGYHWYRTAGAVPTSLQGHDLAVFVSILDQVYEVYAEGP